MTRRRHMVAATLGALAVATGSLVTAAAVAAPHPTGAGHAGARTAAVPRGPVILDEDNAELDDGAQSMFMLLQAHANLIGMTEVAGNTWVEQGEEDTLSQEALIGRHVPVYPGANTPLSGDRRHQLGAEQKLFGPVQYTGAWAVPEPPSYRQLPEPPYGGYAAQAPERESAADFIVAAAHKYPHQLTIIAGGAFTNVALAIRTDPTIVPLVKQIIYMGGAVTVPGNTSAAAEFNVWFDPQAAKIVFNAPWRKQTLVPLDVTNTTLYGKAQYDRIVAGRPTLIKKEFKALQGPGFAKSPRMTSFVYDEIATAAFLDPSVVTSATNDFVDVDTTYGLDFGRTVGYPPNWKQGTVAGPAGSRQLRVVMNIDHRKFFDLYTSLLHS